MDSSYKNKNIGGLEWKCREGTNDQGIIEHVFRDNAYHLPEDMEDKIVVDIGAHIGAFSLLAAKREAEVYAFEPASGNFKLLESNIKNNSLEDEITSINMAIGNWDKTKKLYIDKVNTGQNTFYKELNDFTKDTFETAPMNSLTDMFYIFNIKKCDFLKIDCEGGEVDILPEIIENLHAIVETIGIEFHFPDKEKWIKELEKFYTVTRMQGSEEEYLCTK